VLGQPTALFSATKKALARLADTKRLITGLRLAQGDRGWSEVPAQSSKPCRWCRYFKSGPGPTRLGCPGIN